MTVEHAAQQLIRHRLLNKQAPWQQDDQHAEVPLRPAAAATAAAAEGSGGGGCSRGEACCQSDSTDQQQTGCSRAGTVANLSFLLFSGRAPSSLLGALGPWKAHAKSHGFGCGHQLCVSKGRDNCFG